MAASEQDGPMGALPWPYRRLPLWWQFKALRLVLSVACDTLTGRGDGDCCVAVLSEDGRMVILTRRAWASFKWREKKGASDAD